MKKLLNEYLYKQRLKKKTLSSLEIDNFFIQELFLFKMRPISLEAWEEIYLLWTSWYQQSKFSIHNAVKLNNSLIFFTRFIFTNTTFFLLWPNVAFWLFFHNTEYLLRLPKNPHRIYKIFPSTDHYYCFKLINQWHHLWMKYKTHHMGIQIINSYKHSMCITTSFLWNGINIKFI